jgi:hypothetical protein
MWVDADFIFADFNFHIENILNFNHHAHIIGGTGFESVINTGALIVRNTKWSRQFLHKWWSTNRLVESEQARFDFLYMQENGINGNHQQNSKIEILTDNTLSSIAPVWANYNPDSPVLHLRGEIG